jgi:hypothetical protein
MKISRLIVCLIIAITGVSSCKKKYCWKCTLATTTVTPSGYKNTSYKDSAVCDMTDKERQEYEKSNSSDLEVGPLLIKRATVCQK